MRIIPVTLAFFLFIASSCTIIRQGEVGVKRKLGKINPKPLQAGAKAYNPFTSIILKVPVRTINLEVNLELPSKEGLNVNSEISILYHVDGARSAELIENVGIGYERVLILPIFRAAAADVSAKFMAKDMHTGNRLSIEDSIKQLMVKQLASRGIIIESVLMKSIKLPANLYRAIEEKLQAEQESQRMQFVLDKERLEADRRRIEAQGVSDANKLITSGLTKEVIQFKSIEAFEKLSNTPGVKVIITDGKAPFLITE